ncbi:ArsR/SmtB family transcription factor [Corynebacterium freiburgense]|uniref:ArsR/SmtB family transcription factor n=1 Tax=Corynebacterium freiburgense TaxID=556548 RepID=UPI0025B2DC28|nr:metalloregulator ArsR/SmtB family transcription factor [Corynebacterium freiburgense]
MFWRLPLEAAESISIDLALRALADANRRTILHAIRLNPKSVGLVANELGLSQQTTSHHLRVLQKAGLATVTSDRTRHLYAINTDGLAAVRSYLDDFWPKRLADLKSAIEQREGNGDG